MIKLDELIAEFKKQNGNVSYSLKELLQGMHQKIDNNNKELSEKLDKINICVTEKVETKASKAMVIGMFSFAITLIGALAGYAILK